MLPLACSTPACLELLVVVRFRAVRRCCFLGCCFPLSKDPLVVKLHCFGLQHFGEREGLSEQRALGWFRFHTSLVALRVLPTLQNGVSVLGSRWGGQPVLRSLCACSPGCGSTLRSKCLLLAHLEEHSCLPAALGRRAFSWGPPLLLCGIRRLRLRKYGAACLIDMCLLHLAHVSSGSSDNSFAG